MGGGSGLTDGLKGISIRNGHIRILITHKKTLYSHTLKIKPTPPNIKYAQRQREAWLHEFATGSIPDVFQTKKTTCIDKLLDKWLDAKSQQVKASTLLDYSKSVRLLKEEFGHMEVGELTIGLIRDYCNDSDASAKRLNNLFSPLRQALQYAVEDETIDRNILTGWSCKKRSTSKDVVDPFTAEEQLDILKNMTGQGRNLIQFAFWTGMRTSELVALHWSDVDLKNKRVTVINAQTQAANELEETKTLAGRRIIKLLGPALEALKQQKAFTYLAGKHVFHNPRHNEPWAGDQPIRKTLWTPALKKAKVRYRRPYQTRHTYASMMLSAGEHPMWVAGQMGHADWSMIARTYGKWMPEAMPDAGQKAEAIFGK
jgi:integrase